MKVAILSESDHDEAAIRVLINALLEVETVSPEGLPRLESRGWPSVKIQLPAVITSAHYNTDALGLVVVADSDDSPLHEDNHSHRGGDEARCRTCALQRVAEKKLQRLKERTHAPPLRIAIAVATPTLEAWLYCSRDAANNEDRWIRELEEHNTLVNRRKELKAKVYPPKSDRRESALAEANRLATNLDSLFTHFACGFGSFAEQVRAWTL